MISSTYARHIKIAASTGDNDVSFEQAFSNLAHSYVREKAPTLMDKELGFQMIDRDERSNRASAIMAFQLGKKLVYVPLFFVEGAIKGSELLYLKDQDFFVPLKENWLNQIVNQEPRMLGEPITKNLKAFGVHQPEMRNMLASPSSKFASYDPTMLPGIKGLAKAIVADDEFPKVTTLEEFAAKEGAQAIYPLLEACVRYPKLTEALSEYYDLPTLAKQATYPGCHSGGVLKKAPNTRKTYRVGVLPSEPPPKNPEKSGALVVMMSRISLRSGDLTEDEKKMLETGDIVVRDERKDEEISTAYSERGNLALTNPIETGIYEVLTHDGGFERCLVITQPLSGMGRHTFGVVVKLSGTKSYRNRPLNEIWVKESAKNKDSTGDKVPTDYTSLYEGASSGESLGEGGNYIGIDGKGNGTVGFRLSSWEPKTENATKRTFVAHFDDYCRGGCDMVIPQWVVHDERKGPSYRWGDVNDSVHLLKNEGTSVRAGAGELYLPPEFKFIKVSDKYDYYGPGDDPTDSEKKRFALGSHNDILSVIMEKTAGLKITYDGSEVVLGKERMSPKQALAHLITKTGLRENDAREMLKEAQRHKIARFRVKYAAGGYYDLVNSGPQAPAFPDVEYQNDPLAGTLAQGTYPQIDQMSIGDPRQMPEDPLGMQSLDPNMVQSIMRASQTGQREVLDASVLASMLKANRDDNMVGRHIGPLTNAVNHLGQLIAKFYRHGDKFEDRFGKNDLAALEDSLRNTFEDLGDLVLELKTKQVDPLSASGEFVDIDEAV